MSAGQGEISKPETARSPFDLAAEAGRLALADAGAAQLKGSIDILARGLAGMSTDGARGGRSLFARLPLVGKRA